MVIIIFTIIVVSLISAIVGYAIGCKVNGNYEYHYDKLNDRYNSLRERYDDKVRLDNKIYTNPYLGRDELEERNKNLKSELSKKDEILEEHHEEWSNLFQEWLHRGIKISILKSEIKSLKRRYKWDI